MSTNDVWQKNYIKLYTFIKKTKNNFGMFPNNDGLKCTHQKYT